MISYTGTALITDALTDINVLLPGQVPAADMLNIGMRYLNQMIDAWLIDRMKVFAIRPDIYNLVAGQQIYTIGPAGANFTAARPEEIEDANILLTGTNPLLRHPLEIISQERWAHIRVQILPFAIPLELYYDRNFDPVNGFATINLWPGPQINYQLELYTWQQLQSWPDLVTAINLPPGYASAIRSNLALALAPTAKAYYKTEPVLQLVTQQAREGLALVESHNAPEAEVRYDPMYAAARSKGGAFNYGTGMNGRRY